MYREYLRKLPSKEKRNITEQNENVTSTTATTQSGIPDAPPVPGPQPQSALKPPQSTTVAPAVKPGTVQNAPKKPISKEQRLQHDEWKKEQSLQLADLKKQADDLLKMLNESMTKLANATTHDPVLNGNLSKPISSPAKIIRIFTSSTFTDTKHERNRLMEKTFPNLKSYCQQNGYEFQIVDMRWGIRDEASNDHMTTEICLQELENCQKYSAGPNFLSLLSHKYGYRSLPRQIHADEFEKILKYVDFSDQRKLSKWYIRDDNAVPPKYILQPISTHLPEYIEQGDKEKQKLAKKMWWEESGSMLEAVVTAAEKALPPEEAYKFKLSVTHTEIMHGMLKMDEKHKLDGKRCVWLQRNIADLEEQEPSYQVSRFTECMEAPEKLKAVKGLMEELRHDMTEKMPADNILSYNVKWHEKGLDPSNTDHNDYLEKITNDAEEKLKKMVEHIITEGNKKKAVSVRDECVQHLLFCKSKCEDFQGKKDTLKKVEDYMLSKKNHPLVIHGQSGSGKTSLMAMIAKNSFDWFEGKATVVLRFCGTTPKSSNLLDLLHSLTDQIRLAKGLEKMNIKGIKEVELVFRNTLRIVKTPLVIILDSLDQLDTTYNARTVAWIPALTLPHVRFVVSTLEDPKYEAFPILKGKIPQDGFIPVDTISKEDVTLILDHWLQRKERKLTPEQKDLLLNSYDQCPLPLYLNLCFLEASKWMSYMDMSNLQLYKTVREAINGLFAKLERSHGQIFVSKTLGYLTAAKIGLTENELEDILACDDDVLNDVYVYWTPPIRRLPPLLIVRLRQDIQQYLVERGADDATVIYWYHRQFIEAAQERYCTDPTSLTKLHSSLADFFSGKWANGNKKPFVNTNGEEGAEDRHVVAQPNKFGLKYNLRKLKNLPYHLAKAGRLQQLKEDCLLNFEFLYTKLNCTPFRSVLEDFEVAKEMFNDEQINLILQALHLSEDAILFNVEQFMTQMFIRLSGIKELKQFTDACRQTDVRYLCPNNELLVKVGGPLIYALAGHKSQVEWVDLKQNGEIAVTCCNDDNTVGIWNVVEGRPIRMLESIAKDPCEVYFVANDSMILIYGSSYFKAITELGENLYSFPHTHVQSHCICGKNKDILVCFMKSRKVYLYDIKTGEKTEEINPATCSENKGKRMTPFGLFAFGSDNFAVCTDDDYFRICVVDIEKKQAYLSDKVRFPETPETKDEEDLMIDAVTVTKDGKYIVMSNMYDNIPYLLDINTFEICKSLQGDADDALQGYHISRDGTKMYGISHNDVVVIDMETGTRKKVVHHTDSIDCVISCDMVTFITVSSDSVLRVWDTSRTSTSEEIEKGSVENFNLLPNDRYVFGTTLINRKEYKLVVYDSIDKKIVSQAKFEGSLSRLIFIDDSKAVMSFYKDRKPLDMHMIDLRSMTEVPVQGKVFKDDVFMLKVNSGKEFMLPTRSGRNLKFYDLQTQKPIDIVKLPETLKSTVSRSIATNYNGTMVAFVTYDDKHVVVLDVETRKIVKIYNSKDFKLDDFANDLLIPDNKSFIGVSGVKKDMNYTIFLYDLEKDKLINELTDFEYQKRYKVAKTTESVDLVNCILLDDERILSSHNDSFLRLWSSSYGTLKLRIVGHRTSMSDIHYIPQSPFVLTHGKYEEQTLRLWDKKSMQQISSFKTDEDVWKVKWCNDGRTFVTYSGDLTSVTRWTVHGDSVPEDSNPVLFEGNISDSGEIPSLDIAEVEEDANDIDQEEQAVSSEEEDDDNDDE